MRGDDAIYVARDDGTQPRRVATGIAPTISPDGRWVAYLRPRTTIVEVRLVRATGGASRRDRPLDRGPRDALHAGLEAASASRCATA